MRLILFACLALTLAFAAAPAAAEAQNARTAYVERRGLVEADTRCGLFTPIVRAALQAGVTQARGSLLREGWSDARLAELDRAVADAARTRACSDARTQTAASGARDAFTRWASANSMQFDGWQRAWLARRSVGANGWRLSQAIDAPIVAVFGVRERDGAQRLALVIGVSEGAAAPASARLILRDEARAQPVAVTLPQRISYGLEAGAPPAAAALAIPATRALERIDRTRSQAVFAFPDAAFARLVALDPRESVVLELAYGRSTQRLLVEVGDIAAARAFLAIRP